MTKISTVLSTKGTAVYSIAPESTVLDALKLMAERDIGALIVLSGERLDGVFTERDYARKVILAGKSSPGTPISDVMSSPVVCAKDDQTVDECMSVMTKKCVRHMPVVRDDRVVGIISIGDLVKATIAEQKFRIDQLEHYITS